MSIVQIFFLIFGGLALFLYGLFILSNGFKKIFSRKLKEILERLTENRLRGAFVGTVITSIVQSSSLTMVTLIGLLNAGLLTLKQAVSVMLGAEVGTTVTAQLIAFKIGIYYFPMIVIGFILIFFVKKKRLRYLGEIILGLGILFLGMTTMTHGVAAVKEMPVVINILSNFGRITILGVIAGALFTAIIQSSSASIGLVISMGIQGVIGLPTAIALMMGANIGTCITGFIASIKSCLSARRLAFAQLLVNIFAVLLFIFFIPTFSKFISSTSSDLGRQIANAHTFFNVVTLVAALFFLKYLVVLSRKIAPGKEISVERGAKHLDEKVLNVPSVAILQAGKEVVRMSEVAKEMVAESKKVVFSGEKGLIKNIREKEIVVDELHDIIDNYLTQISNLDLSEEQSKKVALFIHSITDIERVGDHANNLTELAELKKERGMEFSKQAEKELEYMFDKVMESFDKASLSLKDGNEKTAGEVLEIEKEVNQLDDQLRENHYERLEKGDCDSQAGPIYLEIIDNLERISDHAENIAGGVYMGF